MTDQAAAERYEPGQHPNLPPPASTVGIIGWMRSNLFSSPLNAALTLGSLYIVYLILPPVIEWAFLSANWNEGTSRADCVKDGACWTMVRARFGQFIYGRYPIDERWRVDIAFILFFATAIPLLIDRVPGKKYLAGFVFLILPVISFFLFYGGPVLRVIAFLLYGGLGLPVVPFFLSFSDFGPAVVPTDVWGGLMLTLILGIVGIVFSLPLGVLLAIGRRSDLPMIRMLCTGFIEFVRAVPLITVLFMASVMLPLFLPQGVTFDKLLRAMIGIALFGAAYMAEVVRGGLQAIPRGQYEGAMALGLGYWQIMGLIVLPQALRISIPGIVNTFIGLFKDTTLVIVIGLFELLGTVQQATRDANWAGLSHEGFVFAAVVFFVFCFSMSRYSVYLERKLHTGHKKR